MLEYIQGRLAALRIEDPKAYEDYSKFYGVQVEARVLDASSAPTPRKRKPVVVKKSAGRPKKS